MRIEGCSASRARKPRGWWLLGGCALLLSGCARVYQVETPAPPAATSSEEPAPAARRELEQRLAAVERRRATAAEDERAELTDERLALTVALAHLAYAPAEVESATADQLLTAARNSVQRSRERGLAAEIRTAELRQTVDKLGSRELVLTEKALDRRFDLDQDDGERLLLRSELETTRERDGKKTGAGPMRARGKRQVTCAPGDPLCSLDDVIEQTIIATAKVTKKAEKQKGKLYEEGRGDLEPTEVAAARVAHEPTPTGVMRAIRSHFGRVTGCIPPALRQQELQLRIAALLDERGLLRQPRVESAGLDAVTRECIADVFRALRVEDYSGSSRVITIPLWLAAQD